MMLDRIGSMRVRRQGSRGAQFAPQYIWQCRGNLEEWPSSLSCCLTSMKTGESRRPTPLELHLPDTRLGPPVTIPQKHVNYFPCSKLLNSCPQLKLCLLDASLTWFWWDQALPDSVLTRHGLMQVRRLR